MASTPGNRLTLSVSSFHLSGYSINKLPLSQVQWLPPSFFCAISFCSPTATLSNSSVVEMKGRVVGRKIDGWGQCAGAPSLPRSLKHCSVPVYPDSLPVIWSGQSPQRFLKGLQWAELKSCWLLFTTLPRIPKDPSLLCWKHQTDQTLHLGCVEWD